MKLPERPLKVAWFSFFPVEWLPDPPEVVAKLPRLHPATWQRVLVEEFQQRPDLELHVISLRKELPHDVTFRWQNATFHCLRVPGGWRAPTLFWLDTWLIRRKLRSIRPDLVHAWGTENAAALVASRLSYPYLVTMQGLLNWIGERAQLNRYERLAARLEGIALRRTKHVTTEATFSARYLREHYPHLAVEQIEHAPAWLFHRVQRRPEVLPPHFLFVGSITHAKGADLLVQALDRLRRQCDFRLTMIGIRTDYLEALQGMASRDFWDKVVVRERLEAGEVAQEMAAATVLILPTRADTSPNSVKEAVAAGLPVVASAIGGIVDHVLPGKNGFTFEAGSLSGLEAALRDVLVHPLFKRGEVEPDTLSRMRERLSPRVMTERFYSAYRGVIGLLADPLHTKI